MPPSDDVKLFGLRRPDGTIRQRFFQGAQDDPTIVFTDGERVVEVEIAPKGTMAELAELREAVSPRRLGFSPPSWWVVVATRMRSKETRIYANLVEPKKGGGA
jgi:hypothetical protein